MTTEFFAATPDEYTALSDLSRAVIYELDGWPPHNHIALETKTSFLRLNAKPKGNDPHHHPLATLLYSATRLLTHGSGIRLSTSGTPGVKMPLNGDVIRITPAQRKGLDVGAKMAGGFEQLTLLTSAGAMPIERTLRRVLVAGTEMLQENGSLWLSSLPKVLQVSDFAEIAKVSPGVVARLLSNPALSPKDVGLALALRDFTQTVRADDARAHQAALA